MRFGCASFLNDSELLVETGEVEREDTVIQVVSVEGGQLRPFLAIENCGVIDPKPSPATGSVFFLAVCADVGRSGLYQARSDGSGIRQVVAGIVGVFGISKDGRWIVFAFMEPDGDGRNPALYAVDLPAMSFLHVAKPGASWPTWAE